MDKNVPEDLQNLKNRISVAKGKKTTKTATPKVLAATGVGIRVAADLLAGILVGGGIGYVLDDLFETRPIMLVIFLLFGGAAGFLNVYRMVKGVEIKEKV